MIRRALLIIVIGMALSGCEALNLANTTWDGLKLIGDLVDIAADK